MFSNLNTSVNNQQFINQAQTPGMQNWMMGGTSNQSQASPSISNVTNTINLFGNMNITQPVNQSTSSSQATASFSLFWWNDLSIKFPSHSKGNYPSKINSRKIGTSRWFWWFSR